MFGCDPESMTSKQLRVDEKDEREMASAEVELSSDNSGVNRDLIHGMVQTAYDRLTPAKVHTYLPILIVREVRAGLRRNADRTRPSSRTPG